MSKHFFLIALIAISALSSGAKNPKGYYAHKAEEALYYGRYEDALDYARQEIIDYENNPNGYYQAAISLYALQQPGQSLSLMNKAIEKAKKDKHLAANYYLVKADLLKEMGDSVQYLKALNDGLKADKNNVDLLVERGSFFSGSDNKSALKDLQKVKKLAPYDPRGYYRTSWLYTSEGKYKEALDEVTKAISLDNSDSNSYTLRGLILQQLGYSPDWIQDCLKSFELDNESRIGVALLADAKDSNVREQIINEIERRRTPSNGFYLLEANLLYTWDALVLAGKTYQEIINLGIATLETYYYLADCQKQLNCIIDAYTTASIGLDKFPDDLSLQFMKAQIGVLVGKGNEVLGIINSLIAQSPETDRLYTEKGRAYMSMGRYADAVEPFSIAVMLNPSAMNKLYYGDALRLSGNSAKAFSEYNDILKMSKEQIVNETNIPQYMYAMAYSGLGQRDQAISAIKAMSVEQPQAEISFMPVVYARLGQNSEAIAALKEYTKENKWYAVLDLFTYDFYPLHSEPDFAKLLADNGVPTRYNNDTRMLEYVPKNILLSSGGTPLEQAMNLLSENPRDWVKAFNELCPIDMGITGQITSVEYNERTQTATYNYKVNPDLFNIKLFNNNPTYKRKKEDIMALSDLLESPQLADLGITLKYNYIASDGSDKCTAVITPAKMKELSRKTKSQDEIDQMMLEFWTEEESLMLPENPATQNATVKLNGNTLTYTYLMSEEDGTMSRLELFQTDKKNQLSNLFNDPSMMTRIPVYVRQGLTIKYVYKGNITGRTVDFTFTPDEISNYLR